MGFDMLLGVTGGCQLESHMCLLPEVGKMTPFVGRKKKNPFHEFLRNVSFHLSARNPSAVQLQFILKIWSA